MSINYFLYTITYIYPRIYLYIYLYTIYRYLLAYRWLYTPHSLMEPIVACRHTRHSLAQNRTASNTRGLVGSLLQRALDGPGE